MKKFVKILALSSCFIGYNGIAAFASDAEVEALRQEIKLMQASYEKKISLLSKRLEKMESAKKQDGNSALVQNANNINNIASNTRANLTNSDNIVNNNTRNNAVVSGNSNSAFNPAVGIILNGKYSNFSKKDSNMPGFATGDEGTRGKEGLGLDESEINFSANADDKFSGKVTASIVRDNGEDKIELEEAYLQTLPGIGLPQGLTVKAGRALWNFGYLNEHHAHSDDFADRPLPYRAFLNNGFNDDGAQISYVLPTDIYTEIGGGVFRSEDFPGSTTANSKGSGAYSSYAKIGGDIGSKQAWQIGASWLRNNASNRTTNDDSLIFLGQSNLYALDLRYVIAPTGNSAEQEIVLQGEYLWRNEDGLYSDSTISVSDVNYNKNSNGWYTQAIYKFAPQFRVGARYSMLEAPTISEQLVGGVLDSNGYNPKNYALMTDWTNSEFSRIRLQFNREQLSRDVIDNQIMLQYIISLGAHGAHKF